MRGISKGLQHVVLAAVLGMLCGCSGASTVTGKVRYQGRPVIYGSVIIRNADGTAHSGVIEPDGSYTVEGVGRGPVKIAVISRDPSKGRSTQLGEPGHLGQQGVAQAKAAMKDWFPLPKKYEDPGSSGLTGSIESRRVEHDIDLP